MSCAHSNRDLWREVWCAIDDVGLDWISVRWIKAHLSLDNALGRGQSRWEWAINDLADCLAKKAASYHPDCTDAAAANASLEKSALDVLALDCSLH